MKTRFVTVVLLAVVLVLTQAAGPSILASQPVSAGQANPGGHSLASLPPGLAPALAQAAQTDLDPAYQAAAQPGGFAMANPANQLAAAFDDQGLALSGAAPLSLHLAAWGTPGALQAVGASSPVQTGAARVEYRHAGGLTEWYQNSTWGLEQGFTLQTPPAPGADELVLALALSSPLKAAPDSESGLALEDAAGQTVLRYSGLAAWDAAGRSLPAHLELAGNEVRLRVAAGGAVYPLTIDPWLQQAELTATDGTVADGAANDWFGWSVALSGDTALMGAPSHIHTVGSNTTRGAAYVFTRSGVDWNVQAELTAPDGTAGDFFGWSVALSGDTALVGSLYRAAYVFTRSGTTWDPQAEWTTADPTGDAFGGSVALSGDTALVGAYNHMVNSNDKQGAAYVFTRSVTGWSQQAELTAGDGAADDHFGASVALSGDTALVGAYNHNPTVDPTNANQGAAYIFTRSVTGWTQRAELTASDGFTGDLLGVSVALSGDTALTALVGAEYHQGNGAAYIFTGSGADWNYQAELTAPDGGYLFGSSVALSGDTALVGETVHTVGLSDKEGTAYIFTFDGTLWNYQAELTAVAGDPNNHKGHFGNSVALSGDTALVGDNELNVGSNDYQGAAYIFSRAGKYVAPAFACAGYTPCYDSWADAESVAPAGGHVWVYPGTYNEAVALTQNDTATLLGDVTLTGDLELVHGELQLAGNSLTGTMTSNTLTLQGNFTGDAGGTLTGGTLVLAGSLPQTLGGSAPLLAFANLTLDNPTGATLLAPARVDGTLTLQSGLLTLGSNLLTLGPTAGTAGSFSTSAMVVTNGSGELRKEFSAIGSFTYPVGDATHYTPATLNFTSLATAGYAGVTVTPSEQPYNILLDLTNFLSRYWTVTAGGGLAGFDCDTSFIYDPSDVNGSESDIMGGKWDWPDFLNLGLVDPDNHSFGGPVTGFSDFTSGPSHPTAVTLTGFRAQPALGGPRLLWSTVQEAALVGFRLYRAASAAAPKAEWLLLTPELLPPQALGSPLGYDYTYLDLTAQPGRPYTYWLEAVFTAGPHQLFGPLAGEWNAIWLPVIQK